MVGNIQFNKALLSSAANFALGRGNTTTYGTDVLLRVLRETGELLGPQKMLGCLRGTCTVVVLGSALAGYLAAGAFAGIGAALLATVLFHHYVAFPLHKKAQSFALVHQAAKGEDIFRTEGGPHATLTLEGLTNNQDIEKLMLLVDECEVGGKFKAVVLKDCTLKYLPQGFFTTFSSVESVAIKDCDQLEKLPLTPDSLIGFVYRTHTENKAVRLCKKSCAN